MSHEYKILNQWLYRYEPGVFLNKEHAFALELPVETGVTLNPEEYDQARRFDSDAARSQVTS